MTISENDKIEKRVTNLIQSIKDTSVNTRTLLAAILLMFGFQISTTLDSSLFEWSRERASYMSLALDCVNQSSPSHQVNWRGKSINCNSIVDYAEQYFGSPTMPKTLQNTQDQYNDQIRSAYFERWKSALNTYERTAHQMQIPVLGVEVEGNNGSIAANVIMGALMLALVASIRSENRLLSFLFAIFPSLQTPDRNLYKRITVEANIFSGTSKAYYLVWLLLFLPVALRTVDIYYSIIEYRKTENFLETYLDIGPAWWYVFTSMSAYLFLFFCTCFLYWSVSRLNHNLRDLEAS